MDDDSDSDFEPQLKKRHRGRPQKSKRAKTAKSKATAALDDSEFEIIGDNEENQLEKAAGKIDEKKEKAADGNSMAGGSTQTRRSTRTPKKGSKKKTDTDQLAIDGTSGRIQVTKSVSIPIRSVSNVETPAWLVAELEKLRMEAEADYNQQQDVIAANLMELTDQEFMELQAKSAQLHRDPNALKISKDGLLSKFDDMVKKTYASCGFDELNSSAIGEDGEDDGQSDSESEGASAREAEPFNIGQSGSDILEAPTRITFQGTPMELARNADEFEEFVQRIRSRILSYDDDQERRRFVEKYNESTIYRALVSMHKWLVFCATKTVDPDNLTPELLRSFRDWLLTLKTNTDRCYIDKKRFNTNMQKESIGSLLVRVFMVYKMLGIVPTTTRLLHFLGGKEEACIFYSWMDMQAGVTIPYRRFPILPSDVDYFLEQLPFANDKEFEAALYMLTMINVGARSASLIHVNTTCYEGLLAKDVTFYLLPNRRLSCRIKITHEKQSKSVTSVREVDVDDRNECISLPMAMFVHFVRLDLFEYAPADILDPSKFCGHDENRFKLRDGLELEPVFRRWLPDDATELSKFRSGQLTAAALTTDLTFFDLYSKIMRLPKRGFSSRSLRQGLAIRIITQDIKERGHLDKQACLNRLVATGIWSTRVALRYVEDYLRKAFNPTGQVYNSSNGNTTDDNLYVSPSRYRLTPEEYVDVHHPNILELVKSIPEVQLKKEALAGMEKALADALGVAGIATPASLIISPKIKNALKLADVNIDGVIKMKDAVKMARQRLNLLIRERAAQFADDINYRTFTRRLNEVGMSARQELKVTGRTFDFAAMANGVYEYNKREALWPFSPCSKPELVAPGEVSCIVSGCTVKPNSGILMARHLAQKHKVNLTSARTSNTVERFAKRGKRNMDEKADDGQQPGCNEEEESDHDHDDDGDLDADEGNGSDKNGSKLDKRKKSIIKFQCMDPACNKVYGKMSYLATHFRSVHWVWFSCETCAKDYSYSKFRPDKHVGHSFNAANNNFDYGAHVLPKCPKCTDSLVSCGGSSLRCILSMDKVKSALMPEHVDELYAVFKLRSVDKLDGTAKMKEKRGILYEVLKRRLFECNDVELPSCVLKEVQRLYSEDGFVTRSQEI